MASITVTQMNTV